ncbi:MAG: UPF0182 family protein [Eubacteriaceae bacterium]|nr:UPF0182 family protein [Eubacteriaceae bacterium]
MKTKRDNSKVLKAVLIILIVLIILGALFAVFNNIYIDILWYTDTGYLSVYLTELFTKLKMGGILFAGLFVLLSAYFKLLTLSGGSVVKMGGKSFVRKVLPYLIALAIALFASSVITHNLWYDVLEWRNSVPFGETDPIFNKDISFYMFKLPFYKSAAWVGAGLAALLFAVTMVYSTLVVAGKSSFERRMGIEGAKGFFTRLWGSFRIQTALFLCAAFIFGGLIFYLSRYDILFKNGEILYGASYTDVNVTAPLHTVMAVFCLLCALVTLICALTKKAKLMIITYIVSAAVFFVGKGAGLFIQKLIVDPNEYSKEALYISYAIQGSQAAYALDDIEVKSYDVKYDLTAQDIEENSVTVGNISINDYLPALDAYNSTQSIRTYYQFNDVDIDRYDLNGDYTQVFVSARELDTDKLNADAQTWINKYMKYTHGFGYVISPVNTTTNTGQPVLSAYDIPTKTDYTQFEADQPRIYFGESTDEYAIVNTLAKEFDYPSGSNNVENSYDGTAGIRLSLINRIAFCIKYNTMKFLLSTDITGESRVLMNRDIISRAQSIVPFLAFDTDPYLVIENGKLYWMLDAMTTSDRYPYAKPYGKNGDFNYIRSSVKVVMDAYNGEIDFYISDDTDPIVEVYSAIYPELFKDMAEMPAYLKRHIRYSEAYFNIQSAMYLTYHMTNPSVFYNKEDEWAIATQYENNKTTMKVESAYLIMKLPERTEEFLLMVPFTAVNKDNMVAWMAGICDGEDYGQLILYQFEKNSNVYGPMQIEQRIDQDTVIAPQLALLAQEGSSVLRGNLLTIPIKDSILYVEPIYVQATSSSTSIPEMKKVIVSYGDIIIMRDNLSQCLKEIFGETDPEPSEGGKPSGGNPSGGNGEIVSEPTDTAGKLAKEAEELYDKAQGALSENDWAAYGQYMEELKKVLDKLVKLTEAEEGTPPMEEQTPPVSDPSAPLDPVSPDNPTDNPSGGNEPTVQQ